jgi:hypothetical protein
MYGTHPPSPHPFVRGWRSIRRMATSGLYESRHSATIDITRDTIVRYIASDQLALRSLRTQAR